MAQAWGLKHGRTLGVRATMAALAIFLGALQGCGSASTSAPAVVSAGNGEQASATDASSGQAADAAAPKAMEEPKLEEAELQRGYTGPYDGSYEQRYVVPGMAKDEYDGRGRLVRESHEQSGDVKRSYHVIHEWLSDTVEEKYDDDRKEDSFERKAYDAKGNLLFCERRWLGSLTGYAYDDEGRLLEEDEWDLDSGLLRKARALTYDDHGKLLTDATTYFGGDSVSYTIASYAYTNPSTAEVTPWVSPRDVQTPRTNTRVPQPDMAFEAQMSTWVGIWEAYDLDLAGTTFEIRSDKTFIASSAYEKNKPGTWVSDETTGVISLSYDDGSSALEIRPDGDGGSYLLRVLTPREALGLQSHVRKV